MTAHWIWQQPDWPDFNWQAERLAPLLRECVQMQGRLLGMAGSVGDSMSAQSELDALLQNIVTSSAIEGEQLNVGSVRSSLARRLGLEWIDRDSVSQRSEGLAQLMLDATHGFDEPLTLAHLAFPRRGSDVQRAANTRRYLARRRTDAGGVRSARPANGSL